MGLLMTFQELKDALGTSEAVRARTVAEARFDGDLELGAWWVHANALAINVRGDRAAWNDRYARDAVADGRTF